MFEESASIPATRASFRIEALGQARADGYVVLIGSVELYRGTAAELNFTDGAYSVYLIFDEGSNNRPGSGGAYALMYGGSVPDELLIGSSSADWLEGFGGNDYIIGLDGNDNLRGKDGSDVIDGGVGDNLLFGGQGNDVLIGGDGNDGIFADGYLHHRGSQHQ
jgi:Ca2+-binding RTX toxin-like protein